jgi:hypothetical protein
VERHGEGLRWWRLALHQIERHVGRVDRDGANRGHALVAHAAVAALAAVVAIAARNDRGHERKAARQQQA